MKNTILFIAIFSAIFSLAGCKGENPPEPPPVEPPPFSVNVSIDVNQDRSVPNFYRVYLNGEIITEAVITEPVEDERFIHLIDVIVGEKDNLVFEGKGSRAKFRLVVKDKLK